MNKLIKSPLAKTVLTFAVLMFLWNVGKPYLQKLPVVGKYA